MIDTHSLRRAGAAILALLSLPTLADETRTLAVGAATRSYVVHLPQGRAPTQPVPLVVVFHGGGGNAENAARMSGMNARADAAGFIVAYPNGTGRAQGRGRELLTWNTWRCCGAAFGKKVDDVGFVRAMVEAIAREYPVDRRRVFATGLSNGGMMAYRVGCELADVFAAIAPVAGALNTHDCRPSARVAVVAFHGTADQHVLFEGGEPRQAWDLYKRQDNSVAYALDFWRARNGCPAEPKRDRKGRVAHDAWACADGTAVELYAIEGGGHAWPGGEKGLRYGNVDEPSPEVNATDVIWDFFSRHPRR